MSSRIPSSIPWYICCKCRFRFHVSLGLLYWKLWFSIFICLEKLPQFDATVRTFTWTFGAPFGRQLLVYEWYGAVSVAVNLSLLVAMGLLINVPYALITTSVSADLGTRPGLCHSSRALATVTAIIDGTGSIGPYTQITFLISSCASVDPSIRLGLTAVLCYFLSLNSVQ